MQPLDSHAMFINGIFVKFWITFMVQHIHIVVSFQVHKLMLADSVRNRAYKTALMDNKDCIQGKVVLDVGAGTGILSVFCAQAGAAKVYAVEASNVYKIAEEVVKENGFESIIQVGKVL